MSRISCYIQNADLTFVEAFYLYNILGPKAQQAFRCFTIRLLKPYAFSITVPDSATWKALVRALRDAVVEGEFEPSKVNNYGTKLEFGQLYFLRAGIVGLLIRYSYFELAFKLHTDWWDPSVKIQQWFFIENGSLAADRISRGESPNAFYPGISYTNPPFGSTEQLEKYQVWSVWMAEREIITNPMRFLRKTCKSRFIVALRWFIQKAHQPLEGTVTWLDIFIYLREYHWHDLSICWQDAILWRKPEAVQLLDTMRDAKSRLLEMDRSVFTTNKYLQLAIEETKPKALKKRH